MEGLEIVLNIRKFNGVCIGFFKWNSGLVILTKINLDPTSLSQY